MGFKYLRSLDFPGSDKGSNWWQTQVKDVYCNPKVTRKEIKKNLKQTTLEGGYEGEKSLINPKESKKWGEGNVIKEWQYK